MKEAKRYDAVHLRYEDSNIRYGEGCEVEVVAAHDYEYLKAVSGELLEALEALVRINEQHNAAIQTVTGKPAGWKDDYLNQARAAIAKARGEA